MQYDVVSVMVCYIYLIDSNTDKIKNVTNELAKATLTLQKAETEAIKTKREKKANFVIPLIYKIPA